MIIMKILNRFLEIREEKGKKIFLLIKKCVRVREVERNNKYNNYTNINFIFIFF